MGRKKSTKQLPHCKSIRLASQIWKRELLRMNDGGSSSTGRSSENKSAPQTTHTQDQSQQADGFLTFLRKKHADAMDNYPEANVLPREQSDEQDASTLSAILPVIQERNQFEDTYSTNWWEKLKHGTAVYGDFWNNELENGLGDIDIREIDLLNIFWEPGITDIQNSRNLFIVDLKDKDLMEEEFPDLKGKIESNAIDLTKYNYDDTVDTTDKIMIVDWYYKVRSANGRTILHYAKIVGSSLLFASENEPDYTERGWYDHGQYPRDI